MPEKEFGKFTLDEIKEFLVLFHEFKEEANEFHQEASSNPESTKEKLPPPVLLGHFL